MFKFNDLRIDTNISNTPYLRIDASVLNIGDFFDNIHIGRVIVIKLADYKEGVNYHEEDPALHLFDTASIVENTKYAYLTEDETKTKEINFMLSSDDFVPTINVDMNKDPLMVFIYPNEKENPSINAPCNISKGYVCGVVYNKCYIANILLNILSNIYTNDSCLTNYANCTDYLLYKRMQLSFCLGKYKEGYEYYTKLTDSANNVTSNKTCGCKR